MICDSNGDYEIDQTNDKLKYSVYEGAKFREVTGTIEIPSEYEGKAVTKITEYGFSNHSIESVILPNTIVEFGRGAFLYAGLDSINIPNTVTKIGDASLGGNNFKSINISDNVTEIGKYAFNECLELSEVTLGKNINKIDDGAFYRCTKLKSIVLPKSVKSLGSKLFYRYDFNNPSVKTDLEYVFYAGNLELWKEVSVKEDAFEKESKLCFYLEVEPFISEMLKNNYWHYNDNNQPEKWGGTIEVTNSLNGKTYKHESTTVKVSDEYWSMLDEAKKSNMLETVLDPEVVVIYNNSTSKADYESKLTSYYKSIFDFYKVTFEEGKIKVKVDGQLAAPMIYLEINNDSVYVFDVLKYTVKDGKLYEETTVDPSYFSVQNTYVLAN